MIVIREIRYGNWITSESALIPWQVFIEDFERIFDNPKHYHPIPLTEEWLLKFGFTNSDTGNAWYIYNWLHINHFDGRFGIADSDGYVELLELPPIKSVHQLQNLYFALTGSELEITVIQNTAE